jgi:hypothetical protein
MINAIKHSWWDPWEVMLEIQEHPPSTLKASMTGPLGGGDGDPGASTINAKKHQWRTLGGGAGDQGAPTINAKNVDDEALGRWCWRSRSAHHQRKETLTAAPLGGGAGDSGAPTINAENIDDGPPGRCCWRYGSSHHQC